MKPTSAPKKPQTVLDAEARVKAKTEEVAHARARFETLSTELSEAHAAVRAAQTAFDANLPKCTMVKRSWRGRVCDSGPVVIVRRTPAGALFVRHIGADAGHEMMFKWSVYADMFVQAVKRSGVMTDSLELRDVPAEYMPQGAAERAQEDAQGDAQGDAQEAQEDAPKRSSKVAP